MDSAPNITRRINCDSIGKSVRIYFTKKFSNFKTRFPNSLENISPKDPSASTYVKYSVAAALNSLLDGLLVLPVPPVIVEH